MKIREITTQDDRECCCRVFLVGRNKIVNTGGKDGAFSFKNTKNGKKAFEFLINSYKK